MSTAGGNMRIAEDTRDGKVVTKYFPADGKSPDEWDQTDFPSLKSKGRRWCVNCERQVGVEECFVFQGMTGRCMKCWEKVAPPSARCQVCKSLTNSAEHVFGGAGPYVYCYDCMLKQTEVKAEEAQDDAAPEPQPTCDYLGCDGKHSGSWLQMEAALEMLREVGCLGQCHKALDVLEAALKDGRLR